MSDVWVVNASPLILLGKIGKLDLISGLCSRMVIPEGVAHELRAGSAEDAARIWVEGKGAGRISPVGDIDPVVAAWDLGLAETHVLTLCRALPDSEAILDDRAARNCAEALGVRVRGTLAVILLGKRRGLVAEVRPLLDGLLDQSIRIAPAIIETALRLAGE